MTVWPNGLRRWLKAPFRNGVTSSPTFVRNARSVIHNQRQSIARASTAFSARGGRGVRRQEIARQRSVHPLVCPGATFVLRCSSCINWSHSSAGYSVRPMAVRTAVQVRVGPPIAAMAYPPRSTSTPTGAGALPRVVASRHDAVRRTVSLALDTW